MNIYDKIKNPIDDEKIIETLVNLYEKNGKIDYYSVIGYGDETEITDRDSAKNEFYNTIFKDCLEHSRVWLLERLKNANLEKYDNARNRKITNLQGEIDKLNDRIKEYEIGYKKIKNTFPNTYFFVKNMKDNSSKIVEKMKKAGITENEYEQYIKYKDVQREIYKLDDDLEELKKENPDYKKYFSISEKYSAEEMLEIFTGKKIVESDTQDVESFVHWIYNLHNFHDENIMGFHIYKRDFEKVDRGEKIDDAKLYINADFKDVYKIASLYWEKAEQTDINYNFKVCDPCQDKMQRKDRLCVYTTLKDFNRNVEILEEIQKEHPELKFKAPIIIDGKIGNNIGVGVDPKDKTESSYNVKRSRFLNSIFEKLFPGKTKEDRIKSVKNAKKNNKNLISYIQDAIRAEVKKSNISDRKFCLDKDMEEEFINITSKKESTKKKNDSNKPQEVKENNKTKVIKKDIQKNDASNEPKEKKEKIENDNVNRSIEKKDENKVAEKKNKENEGNEEKNSKEKCKKSYDEQMKNLKNDMKNLIIKMTMDYINHIHENTLKQDKEYSELIAKICDLKISEMNEKLSRVERGFQMRQLDYLFSAVFDNCKKAAGEAKLNGLEFTKENFESLDLSLEEIDKFCSKDNKIEKINKEEIIEKNDLDFRADKSSLNESAKTEDFPSNPYIHLLVNNKKEKATKGKEEDNER